MSTRIATLLVIGLPLLWLMYACWLCVLGAGHAYLLIRGYLCGIIPALRKKSGLASRIYVGATTAPPSQVRGFFISRVARGTDSPFLAGRAGRESGSNTVVVRRSYVRYANLHGLPPSWRGGAGSQPCNVGAHHG